MSRLLLCRPDVYFITSFKASRACQRDETSFASVEHQSRITSISLSSFFSNMTSCLRCKLVQLRKQKDSLLFDSSLYRHGGTLTHGTKDHTCSRIVQLHLCYQLLDLDRLCRELFHIEEAFSILVQ